MRDFVITNLKTRSIIIQAIVVSSVIAVIYVLVTTAVVNLQARGIPLGLEFLNYRAGFTITESLLSYDSDRLYRWAIVVGIANTLFVWAIVAVLSTILGVFLGIARLSENPLVGGLARVWVETARNTPPILLLIFLYSLWWLVMPPAKDALQLVPGTFLSIRGFAMPKLELGWNPFHAAIGLFAATIAIVAAVRMAVRYQSLSGVRPPFLQITLAIIAFGILIAFMTTSSGMSVEYPEMRRTSYRGGTQISPELFTIIVGLTYYTTGFIAEIVRSGILAVPKGQWEAARAVGLEPRKILRLIILPQTLKVIVPPMTSQYINLMKNSTLAIAVGYPDFMVVMTTIINQTSHAIEGVAIIIGVYLVINLTLSVLLNIYNRRVALVER